MTAPELPRLVLVDRTMKARTNSDCSLCWGLIRVGERIGRLTDGSRAWVHINCLPAIRDSRRRAQLAETFWCEHCHGTHPLSEHARCRKETTP